MQTDGVSVAVVQTTSAEMTQEFAQEFAARLKPGDFVFLEGGLGAGKTTFTQGLAQGLGVQEQVISPTYTIARTYTSGRLPLIHIDAYRLLDSTGASNLTILAELEAAGLEDTDNSVTVVEWGSSFADSLAPNRYEISLSAPSEEVREIKVTTT